MNVLIFVSVLLMLLASISYNELQIFYRRALSHAGWVRFMDTIEGCRYNEKMKEIYEGTRKSKKDPEPKVDSLGHQLEEDKEPKSTGSARINFKILFGKIEDLLPEKENQYNELMKNLIIEVYGKTNFYQKLLAKRPDFVDELLLALKNDFVGQPITKAKQIKKLELKDPELNDIFYLMLRNMPEEKEGKETCDTISLLDFLTDSPRTQIRVFLAPRAILLAAFKDPRIVDQIIEKRKELYEKVNRDEYQPKQATEEFENAFNAYTSFHEIMDFSVTKTNPANYEH